MKAFDVIALIVLGLLYGFGAGYVVADQGRFNCELDHLEQRLGIRR